MGLQPYEYTPRTSAALAAEKVHTTARLNPQAIRATVIGANDREQHRAKDAGRAARMGRRGGRGHLCPPLPSLFSAGFYSTMKISRNRRNLLKTQGRDTFYSTIIWRGKRN